MVSMLPLGVFANQIRAEQKFGVLSLGGRALLMAMPLFWVQGWLLEVLGLSKPSVPQFILFYK